MIFAGIIGLPICYQLYVDVVHDIKEKRIKKEDVKTATTKCQNRTTFEPHHWECRGNEEKTRITFRVRRDVSIEAFYGHGKLIDYELRGQVKKLHETGVDLKEEVTVILTYMKDVVLVNYLLEKERNKDKKSGEIDIIETVNDVIKLK